jgi:hypothetical protein
MNSAQPSDAMKNLVRFIIVLSLLGMVLVVAFYVAGIIPVHAAALLAPTNSVCGGCY